MVGYTRKKAAELGYTQEEVQVKIIENGPPKDYPLEAKIQGDEIRIQGKKRDDLQNAMDIVRELKLNQPIQFINLRD